MVACDGMGDMGHWRRTRLSRCLSSALISFSLIINGARQRLRAYALHGKNIIKQHGVKQRGMEAGEHQARPP